MTNLQSVLDSALSDPALWIPEGFEAFSGMYKIHDVVNKSLEKSVIEAYAIAEQYVDLIFKILIEDNPKTPIKNIIKKNIDISLVIRTMHHTEQLINNFYSIHNEFNSTRNLLVHKILFNKSKIEALKEKDINQLPIQVIDGANEVFRMHVTKKYKSGYITENPYFLVYVIDFASWNLQRPYRLTDTKITTNLKFEFVKKHCDFVDQILDANGTIAKMLMETIVTPSFKR